MYARSIVAQGLSDSAVKGTNSLKEAIEGGVESARRAVESGLSSVRDTASAVGHDAGIYSGRRVKGLRGRLQVGEGVLSSVLDTATAVGQG